MSFISKLFRKGETAEVRADVVAAPVPDAPDRPDAAEEQRTARAAPDQPPDMDGPPAAAASDVAWWEESRPLPEADGLAMAEARPCPKTTDLAPVAPAADSAREALKAPGEASGTRPLSATDAPGLAAARAMRGLAVAALRDVGRVRSANQDSVFAMIITLPRESSDIAVGLFVVADGMGGHHGGEIASRMAISTVAHYVLSELVVPALTDGSTEALQPLIVAAVQEANRAIWEHAQLIGSDMGTTCTVALLLGRALYIGHVGDSRAYLATGTGLRLLTDDHSTVGRLIKLGQLDLSEAREHPLRSQLYRTIGQQPEVVVDFSYQQIGDATHLLLCSDGLWSLLGDEVMHAVLEQSLWPQDACQELIARANLAGGDDNITAIVVSLPGVRSQESDSFWLLAPESL